MLHVAHRPLSVALLLVLALVLYAPGVARARSVVGRVDSSKLEKGLGKRAPLVRTGTASPAGGATNTAGGATTTAGGATTTAGGATSTARQVACAATTKQAKKVIAAKGKRISRSQREKLRRAVRSSCGTGSAPAAPAPSAPSAASPVAAERVGMQTGINSSAWTKVQPAVGKLGARLARIEWAIGTPVEQMRPTFEQLAAQGARIVPMAGFYGRLPSAAEARSLRAWADAYGPNGTFWRGRSDGDLAIRDIEFGNETSAGYQFGDNWDKPSFSQRAANYGRVADIALDALDGSSVGLMVNADSAGTGSSNWVDNMLGAAPDLGRRVSAWTVHPYGPGGADRIRLLIKQTAAAGAPADVPIAATEWGVSTDNGRCLSWNFGFDPCMSYDTAASTIRTQVPAIRAAAGGRMKMFLVYSSFDLAPHGADKDLEGYFGLVDYDGADKGALSAAARDLFAGRL